MEMERGFGLQRIRPLSFKVFRMLSIVLLAFLQPFRHEREHSVSYCVVSCRSAKKLYVAMSLRTVS